MNKEELIIKKLNYMNQIFNERPGMLGKTYQIEPLFLLIDQLLYIIKHGEEMKSNHWIDYLCEKKLIIGGEKTLDKILLDSPNDYALLQNIRTDYLQWLDNKQDNLK